MKTLAVYYRASVEDTNIGESNTIQNQRDLLHHYIKTRPEFLDWNILEYQDDGFSGTTFNRPGIQKILKLAGKEIDCIVVKDFSRFGRNLIEVGNYLDQIFPFLGVRFIAVNDNYDSKENVGRSIGLDVSLKALVYEMYSRDLSQKISSVKEAQMGKGQYIGRIAFYGYRKSDIVKNTLEVDPEAADVVKRIFTLAGEGMKPVQIARLLNSEEILPPFRYRRIHYPDHLSYCPRVTNKNLWTHENVRNIIKDERYTGCFIGRKQKRIDITSKRVYQLPPEEWIRVENTQEAIISKELFQKAQDVLGSKHRNYCSTYRPELFRGLLKCECCGRTLKKFPSKEPYFYCPTRDNAPDYACAKVWLDKVDLEKTILSTLQMQIRLLNECTYKQETSTDGICNQIELMQTELTKYKSEQILLFEKFAANRLDRQQFLSYKENISAKIDEIIQKKKLLSIKLQNIENLEQTSILNFKKYAFTSTLTRNMLDELVQKIRVFPDNTIEIVWNFQLSVQASDTGLSV